MYDRILRLPVPRNVKVIGFADDIAVIVVAKHIQEVEIAANDAIILIRRWLEAVKLSLAEHKTEAVLITSRKVPETIRIEVGDRTIESTQCVKYLGVMLDNRLSFKRHLEYASKKASAVQAALSRMMPNIGGPRAEVRRLLAQVTCSVLLYASPV